MADDDHSTTGAMSGLTQMFIAQLRAVTEGLENLTGSGERLPPAPGAFPLPGGLSAAQLSSIADSIAAQRRSIEALKAQLSAFDEQLAVLEKILGPFAAWSRAWAEYEERLLNMRSESEAEGSLLTTGWSTRRGTPTETTVAAAANGQRQRPGPVGRQT